MRSTRIRAFTLVELLVVVAIIAILGGITLPVYQIHSTRARITEVIVILESLSKEVMLEYNLHGVTPTSLNEINGDGGGSAGTFQIPGVTTHMFYDNGSTWINNGALVRVTIPTSIGQAVPNFTESTDGTDGDFNSLAMAFYADGDSLVVYCGRWDSSSDLYIPIDYLPGGCRTDGFMDIVAGIP